MMNETILWTPLDSCMRSRMKKDNFENYDSEDYDIWDTMMMKIMILMMKIWFNHNMKMWWSEFKETTQMMEMKIKKIQTIMMNKTILWIPLGDRASGSLRQEQEQRSILETFQPMNRDLNFKIQIYFLFYIFFILDSYLQQNNTWTGVWTSKSRYTFLFYIFFILYTYLQQDST